MSSPMSRVGAPKHSFDVEIMSTPVWLTASIELIEPRSVIGKSTVESLQSGAVYGFAASVDGMVDRFQDELGGGAVVVATGGLAPVIAPVASTLEHVEPYLTLHGLRIVHARNTER
jgi:type III pantothenate kinase